jgi:dihydroxy-acid dehydratase
VPPVPATRGYRRLFLERVLQADQGADFDFLRSTSTGEKVPRTR